MDTQSQEILNKILAKDINDLTDYDKRFLKARSDYLSDEQKKVYLVEEKVEIPYDQLLKMAKEKGYTGGRIARAELEKYLQIES